MRSALCLAKALSIASFTAASAITRSDDAGIDMALVVSFENPPVPSHPVARGIFS